YKWIHNVQYTEPLKCYSWAKCSAFRSLGCQITQLQQPLCTGLCSACCHGSSKTRNAAEQHPKLNRVTVCSSRTTVIFDHKPAYSCYTHITVLCNRQQNN
uniref:Uncharacterized protein n=1 Tax=Scleropages formosus TaxID=113540 RepID=A0A8C9WMW7_SCLFO